LLDALTNKLIPTDRRMREQVLWAASWTSMQYAGWTEYKTSTLKRKGVSRYKYTCFTLCTPEAP
jgi:hypothetical protein